jgi:hypothetical protein
VRTPVRGGKFVTSMNFNNITKQMVNRITGGGHECDYLLCIWFVFGRYLLCWTCRHISWFSSGPPGKLQSVTVHHTSSHTVNNINIPQLIQCRLNNL